MLCKRGCWLCHLFKHTWAFSPTPSGPIVQAQWLIPAWPKITRRDLPQRFVYSSLITAVPRNHHLVFVFTLCATDHTTTDLMWSIWRGLVNGCVSVPLLEAFLWKVGSVTCIAFCHSNARVSEIIQCSFRANLSIIIKAKAILNRLE